MNLESRLGATPVPSGLHERREYDQRERQPEHKAPRESGQRSELVGNVPGTRGRSVHWRSIALLGGGITLVLAQLGWLILLIYGTVWLWGELPL